MMWPERDVLHLVALIYDASADARLWPVFLESLCAVAGGRSASLLQNDAVHPHGRLLANYRLDPGRQESFDAYYGRLNVWFNKEERPLPDTARTGEMACPASELVKTEFYQDFLRPQDIFHSLGACIKVDANSVPFCTVFRSRRDGPFGREHIDLMVNLTPHLRRALELQDRMAACQAQSAAALAALDTIPTGCLLVDKAGRCLLANRAAREILDARDGLTLAAGELGACRPEQQELLRQLIFAAAMTIDGSGLRGGGALTVGRASGKAALQVLVVPFRPGLEWGSQRPAALVFVTDPERELRPDHEVLAALFGLTRAEARVAAALINGKSIERCAEELEISRHTARNHLKAIFSKTGTTRQGQLVRTLMNSAASVRIGE